MSAARAVAILPVVSAVLRAVARRISGCSTLAPRGTVGVARGHRATPRPPSRAILSSDIDHTSGHASKTPLYRSRDRRGARCHGARAVARRRTNDARRSSAGGASSRASTASASASRARRARRQLRNPSDNSLAVGPDHIVQIVNSRMAIFTKKGKRFDTTGQVLYGPVDTQQRLQGLRRRRARRATTATPSCATTSSPTAG